MCAENSLGSRGYHRSDSVEIMKGREFISSGDRLLMYIDDHKNPRLYQVDATSDSPKLVRQWNEELCSASPETLQQVLTWTAQKFPADEYGLVMWSHADGWIPAQNPSVNSSEDSGLKSKQAPFAPYSWGIDVGAGGSMSTDKGADGGSRDRADDDSKTCRNFLQERYISKQTAEYQCQHYT